MKRTLALLGMVLFGLAFAPAPVYKERKTDPRRFEGIWLRVTPGMAKLTVKTPVGQNRIVIKGKQLIYNPDSVPPTAYNLVFDAKASPASYDITWPSSTTRSYLGIWKIEGDTLTLCYNAASSGRPKGFEGPGKGTFTEIYERFKE